MCYLRPAVLLGERIDLELLFGSCNEALMEEVKGADLLLVAATSLKRDALDLVGQLAGKVHESEGAVVMIDSAEFSPGMLSLWVDFYLQMDVQVCAEAITAILDKVMPFLAWLGLRTNVVCCTGTGRKCFRCLARGR